MSDKLDMLKDLRLSDVLSQCILTDGEDDGTSSDVRDLIVGKCRQLLSAHGALLPPVSEAQKAASDTLLDVCKK